MGSSVLLILVFQYLIPLVINLGLVFCKSFNLLFFAFAGS
jgi:hypothetical protein